MTVNNMSEHCDGAENHYYEIVNFCGGTVDYFMWQWTIVMDRKTPVMTSGSHL